MGKLALPPGFRFHPTDEELVSYYLKRKNYGRKIDFDAIGNLDLYKFEPWDLPELARLQTKDLEWYFFCPRDKKYPNGSRTNRATENGYWKATGKDRAVSSRSISVGMKKTLVYYKGRAPKGERTNWVMHEYRLEDRECEGEAFQNCFVLCRIYQKSGAGPKNGEQYGAPVEEEEWETGPASETGDITGFGAILQAYQVQDTHHSVDVAGEQLSKETKQISLNGSANGHVVLKAEPEDVKVFEREEMQCTNLPVQMIAELYGRSVINEDVMGYANTSDEEPEHSANVVAMFLSPPDDGEEEILEEIQDLVATSNQSDCNVGPSSGAHLEAHVGFDERDAHLPRDGDFFELNDLSPICDSDGMVEQTNARKEIWETNGNTSRLQSVLEDVQPRAPLTPWSFGSCGQAGGESSLDELKPYSGLYGAVSEICSTGGEELEHDNIPDFFKNYNTAGAGERESYNPEFDGGRLLAGHVQSEGLAVCPAGLDDRDEQYLDAFLSFSDMVDMNLLNTGLSSLDTIDDPALSGKPWIEKKEELGKVHVDNGTTAGASSIDMTSRNSSASAQTVQNYDGTLVCNKRSEAANASDGRGTASKAFGVILHCLESLPILPASAADMSSRSGTPLGSISVVASSVDIRAVAVNCSCINKDGVASSCMTCSFEKKGTFVHSLSYTGRRMVVKDSSTGFLALGVMGAIWAFFWFLIVGGSWKLLGGAFRLIFS